MESRQAIGNSETAVDASIESNTAASNANNAATNTNTEIASDIGKSGTLISELQTIFDNVSKHPDWEFSIGCVCADGMEY